MNDLPLQWLQGQTPLVWLQQKMENSCVATVIEFQGLPHATKTATVLICPCAKDFLLFAEEWIKSTENALQYKDTHTYVNTLTHLHLVSVGLTQVHPSDYNYTEQY